MKKSVAVIMAVIILFSFYGCKKKNTDNEANTGTTTLMVYMVGSDLESKASAATNDLQEMAASNIDLATANIVVCAGGSKKWHNDTISADSGHTVLTLTENGFSKTTTMSDTSMGEAASLTEFLNYAYKNYPADSFSLIMWDHGNGPIIGYGKDMLFDNDTLTLAEMKTALENSPFNSQNKLSWIGFDACLMASAELAVMLKDFADYLIASQEIEPSFGWDYSFLADLTGDRTALFEKITSNYLSSCEEYYNKKGFSNRDTTLSCVDLSYADELETAINSLFKNAASDIYTDFDSLSVSRAHTRALGRASTGSEYDLIDIYDMAYQMSASYPEETKALQDVLSKMVVYNKTNAQSLYGMSVYYPFYNKTHYEKSWGEVYGELGVLSDYADYLSSYSEIWLKNDKLEENAESNKPEQETDKKFTLTLSEEQSKNFVSARYYILTKKGDELYLPVFSSQDITKNGNVLTANFNGDILYARDGLGKYILPATTQHDTVGDITRYSFYVNLTNEAAIFWDTPEGYEHKVEGFRFQIAANSKTKEIAKSALVPYNQSVDGNALMGGKLEDADLSQWTKYYFISQRHIYLTRYDNGTIKPLSQWPESDYISGYTSRVEDGVEFLFAPLTTGEYSLIIEVTDTQGNKYCSDLIDFSANGSLEYNEPEPMTEVSWTEGEKVKLFEESGVTLYLTSVTDYSSTTYALQATNSNDFPVAVLSGEVIYNNEVYCYGSSFGYFSVQPGKTETDDGFSFGDVVSLGILTSQTPVDSIQFSVSVVTYTGNKTLINNKWVDVKISDETNFMPPPVTIDDFQLIRKFYHLPSNDILATEQVLFEKDGLKATLVGMGGDGGENSALVAGLKIENTNEKYSVINIQGLIFDGIFIEKDSGPITVPGKSTLYKQIYISYDDMQALNIISPSSVIFCIKFMQYATLEGGGGFAEWEQFPVNLSQKGSGCTLNMGSDLVYNENSVKIYLDKVVLGDENATYDHVYFTVENNSTYDIHVSLGNYHLNSKFFDPAYSDYVYSVGTKCPAGTRSVFKVSVYKDYAENITLETDISIFDMAVEKVLFPDAVKTIKVDVK